MPLCQSCGTENPEQARFCFACGAVFPPPSPPREARKVVTVVFSDVAGSTRVGEQLDPEALRRVMSRYFDQARAVLERHGGTVEKFIGDAVMAVFGVPTLHEDDALRAVRAAAELQEAVARLNDELEAAYGIRLETRIGVNTGEVVAGDGAGAQRLATGDAVNVAARLEQAAPPGGILLGADTYRLVRDAVHVELVEPVAAKGKSEPLAAYRVIDVLADAPAFARRLETPLVGRERERRLLREAFERAADERACHLFTLLGPAGVGKSRLAAELVSDLGPVARVLRGRCLPYGEGITFWPLVEILGELGADERAEPVAAILGGDAVVGSPEETFWTVRKLFEALASERPLVIVLDDLHWAEPTFLDLVEHIADWSRDAPLLLLCLGRPELLELRPGWGGGKLNATSILLEPLSDDQTAALIEALLGTTALEEAARARIRDAAEGNPLFVEQMVAMLNENGGTEVAVPPTIQALLAARLDRLPREERAAVERASIEGKVFHQGAVRELTPPETRERVADSLLALLRKQLIGPGESGFEGEQAFRFAHLLIRDAAYDALPKQERAELHERFATWLERTAGERAPEYEEIVGYHLERAHRYRLELGRVDDDATRLARRAAERLGRAGRRALARSDLPATRNLLERATSLLPDEAPGRLELLPDLAMALFETGALEQAESLLAAALAGPGVAADPVLSARLRLEHARLRAQRDPDVTLQHVYEEAAEVGETLERHGDDEGVARALTVVGTLEFFTGHAAQSLETLERSAASARRSGARAQEIESLVWLLVAAVFGPTPASAGIELVQRVLAEARGERRLEAIGPMLRASFEAMLGRFDVARASIAEARQRLEDFGLQIWLVSGFAINAGDVEMLARDHAAAESYLRRGCDELERLGETGYLSTLAGDLANVLCSLERHDEAESLAGLAERTAASDDIASQIGWRSARARVLGRRGEHVRAEELAREAVAVAARTDYLNLHGRSLDALGEVLSGADRGGEAAAALEQAARRYDQKENVAAASRTRERLAALEAAEI